MAMKLKEIKFTDEKAHETKIQRFIEILTDFVDERMIKVSKNEHKVPEKVILKDGRVADRNTWM